MSKGADLMTCCCGHVGDEHRWAKGHFHECEVEGCDCIGFDPEEDDDEEEEQA